MRAHRRGGTNRPAISVCRRAPVVGYRRLWHVGQQSCKGEAGAEPAGAPPDGRGVPRRHTFYYGARRANPLGRSCVSVSGHWPLCAGPARTGGGAWSRKLQKLPERTAAEKLMVATCFDGGREVDLMTINEEPTGSKSNT